MNYVQVGVLISYRMSGLNAFMRYLVALEVLHEFRSGGPFAVDILNVPFIVSQLPKFYFPVFGECPLEAATDDQLLRLSYHWTGCYLLFSFGADSLSYRYYMRSISLLDTADNRFLLNFMGDMFNR